jgi:tetratricopeptide (TPR) repeat protein
MHTMKRSELLAAADKEEWRRVLDLVDGLGDEAVQGDPPLARATGIAAEALARSPFDRALLARAEGYLTTAWELGSRDSGVLWPLARARYSLAMHREAADVLERYLEETPDAEERVRAGAFLGQVWDVLEEHAAAVDAHQRSLDGPGGAASPAVRLESYLNAHLARAYGRAGCGHTWRQEALGLWETLPEVERSIGRAVYLLRGADLSAGGSDGLPIAVALGEALLGRFEPMAPTGTVRDIGHLCDLYTDLFVLCHRSGMPERAAELRAAAKGAIEAIREPARCCADENRLRCDLARTQLHNLGYQCREAGQPREALALFRESTAIPPVNGPTWFFLAALTLETGGDRQESLAHLRRAAQDPDWAPKGACDSLRRAFSADPAFAAVRDDPQFLAVVASVG